MPVPPGKSLREFILPTETPVMATALNCYPGLNHPEDRMGIGGIDELSQPAFTVRNNYRRKKFCGKTTKGGL
jgi:hypothetical protein